MVSSLYILLRSGLNYAVYGSCNKQNPEACVVTAEVCGIANEGPTFLQSVRSGHVITAFQNEFASLADTLQTVPSRFRNWNAADYLPQFATFRGGYDAARPVALEVLDPGCGFCAQLFRNISEAGFSGTHNVSYIAYPIIRDGRPQFANSELVVRYLTALRIAEADNPRFANNPTDWTILEHIFTETTDGQLVEEAGPRGLSWQFWFNTLASRQEATDQLHAWLREAGYSDADIAEISELADSQQVTDVMEDSRAIVQDRIRTLTIPTMIAGGRLHRGAVPVEDLREMTG